MKITITAALDDGTQITRVADVNSSDNPLFWSHGIQRGADWAVDSIRRMVEAEYGESDTTGIHIVRAG